jgi:hypothetical protein
MQRALYAMASLVVKGRLVIFGFYFFLVALMAFKAATLAVADGDPVLFTEDSNMGESPHLPSWIGVCLLCLFHLHVIRPHPRGCFGTVMLVEMAV